jgi:type VI secretion system protein VasJ
MAEGFEHIVALGRDPISPTAPAGEPIRYHESFEKLQAQMDRVGSLSGEPVDWPKVVDLSSEILKSRCKDLLVMTYLALGCLETQGYAGLNAAMLAYRELLTNFWDGCFPKPKPPQGRYNAVQYLADKLLALVTLQGGQARKNPAADEKQAVHDCTASLELLDNAVTTAFTGQGETPNLLLLIRAFRALRDKVGPLGEPAAPTGAEAAGAAAGGGPVIPGSFTSPESALDAVVEIGKFLQRQDNKDPRGYRLLRAAYFGGWTEPPKTKFVPGPPEARRQFFATTAAAGDWPALLDEAEGQFAATPLWLDMQRYVSLALNGLGPAYRPVADAVALEAIALHQRLPAVFDVQFKDGTPFADGATRTWIADLAGSMGGERGGAAAMNGDVLADAIGEARKLLSEAKGPEAIERLTARMDALASRRERFRAQLALAGFCMDMNKLALAASLLEGLERQIDQYNLEDWEPELAVRATERLFECLVRTHPKAEDDDARRQAQVFARLCRLNPAAALRLEPKG